LPEGGHGDPPHYLRNLSKVWTLPDSDKNSLKNVQLKQMLNAAKSIVAFTGAGISAESGIPTFRGVGGLWTQYDPEKAVSIEYFRRDPSYYWQFFRDVRHDLMIKAQPNAAHLALVELERRGKLRAVITQNIDGLHHSAGSKTVLELHGNTRRFYCVRCRKPFTIEQAWEMLQTKLPPECDKCGGVLRPDVVLFGEFLPEDVVHAAETEASTCDLMLVVGSSLVVYPAANLPYLAKRSGAQLVIINIDPTPLDCIADLVLHTAAGEALRQTVMNLDEG
ncbi:MAG: NAD-dependent protein deacetylase, partial [Calditrichota bacterium]